MDMSGSYHQPRGATMYGSAMQQRAGFGTPMQAMGHSSINSLQLGDALLGQSNHVSDYSSSVPQSHHGSSGFSMSYSNHTAAFDASHSSGFHASDGLSPPSASNADGMTFHDSNYMRQQQQRQQAQQQQQQGGTMHPSGTTDMDQSFSR